jgi:nitric oxide reductase large subunit
VGELPESIGAAMAALIVIPLALVTLYGIFVMPWIATAEELREGHYGTAIFCFLFLGGPMLAIIFIVALNLGH